MPLDGVHVTGNSRFETGPRYACRRFLPFLNKRVVVLGFRSLTSINSIRTGSDRTGSASETAACSARPPDSPVGVIPEVSCHPQRPTLVGRGTDLASILQDRRDLPSACSKNSERFAPNRKLTFALMDKTVGWTAE